MKYMAIVHLSNGNTLESDGFFDTYEEAFRDGEEIVSDYDAGGVILEMSNPGDYPYEEDKEIEIEVVEVDE